MRIGILTANLGKFDEDFDMVKQNLPKDTEVIFHRWTDSNFPPITGLTPRFQYRIPKLFGWQMFLKQELFEEIDIFVWLDGSMSFQHPDSIKWLLEQFTYGYDMLFFEHPWRKTIKEEVEHIEEKLQENSKYLTSRYKNGLHKECYAEIMKDEEFADNRLFASTMFAYANTLKVREALKDWWWWQSRFYSCDQIPLPYVLWKNKIKVKTIKENVFEYKYLTLSSKHS